MDQRLLAIYLNDHLAGSTVGVELARRVEGANRTTDFGPPLAELAGEIDEDRETLRAVMRRLGVAEARPKQIGAWAGEKLGRLKFNGQLRGYSPLSRVVEIEGLLLGVEGKRALWRALERSLPGDPRVAEFDWNALAERAEGQDLRLEELRLRAVAEAFRAQAPGAR
jgi:hypothetical protein